MMKKKRSYIKNQRYLGGKMIEINNVMSKEKIDKLRTNYFNTLISPIDGYWEMVVIGNSKLYEIIYDKKIVGYFSVTSRKTLVEFYISKEYYMYSEEIFKYIISSDMVADAEVSTKQPEFLSLCLDFHKEIHISSYLFTDAQKVKYELNHFENLCFRLAKNSDIEDLKDKCDSAFEGYYEELIKNNQLFVLYDDDILLGMGEFRIIKREHGGFGDIGMVVATEHRRKGVGTYIITKLSEQCYKNGVIPMAGCDSENIASKNTLTKAGLISEHRIINVKFNTEEI